MHTGLSCWYAVAIIIRQLNHIIQIYISSETIFPSHEILLAFINGLFSEQESGDQHNASSTVGQKSRNVRRGSLSYINLRTTVCSWTASRYIEKLQFACLFRFVCFDVFIVFVSFLIAIKLFVPTFLHQIIQDMCWLMQDVSILMRTVVQKIFLKVGLVLTPR